jgi:hypothetical protein
LSFLSLLSLGAFSTTMVTEFDWLASDSAPQNYPMEIIRGSFNYPDGGSLYIPNGKILDKGWGKSISTHVVGPDLKPLPSSIDITFFSYAEDQFYQGSFDLPYKQILEMFNHPFLSRDKDKEINYHRITAGVAPGGVVTVWVEGKQRRIEVFSGIAEKVDLDWSNLTTFDEMTREELVELTVEDTRKDLSPEEQTKMASDPVPVERWKSYRKRFNWQPLFTGQDSPELIDIIHYLNGELDFIEYPLKESFTSELHAVPSDMIFTWEWPVGRPRVFKFYFDEHEIWTAFEELDKDGLPLFLEYRMVDENGKRGLQILVRNEKRLIPLNATTMKTYGVPK